MTKQHNTASLLLLLLLALAVTQEASGSWLYTLPQDSCESFETCQDCVVEYAWDTSLRRPCTWCPKINTCQMMNHYTGRCPDGGETIRDTCPIMADLPPCVTLQYSFWVCNNARPRSRDQCDEAFVNGFCSPRNKDRQVKLCNGDSFVLEEVKTGFGWMDALTADKNAYGLELNVEYFWFDAGHGEDRRRIETALTGADVWLCNAQSSPEQSIVTKYRVQREASLPQGSPEVSGAQRMKALLMFLWASLLLV